MDILKSSRDDELRHGLERQIYQLQQQVDEFRRSLRGQQARIFRIEELLRQTEANLLGVVQGNEQNRQELNQFVQVVQMDLQRLRSQVTSMEGRIEDPMVAIRELRAHLSDLLGTRRREEGTVDELRTELHEVSRLLQTALSEVSAIKGEQRSLSSSLLSKDAALEDMRATLANLNSAIQLEEQRARRQVEEAVQRFAGLATEVTSLASELRLEIESRRGLQGSVDDLKQKLEDLVDQLRIVADRAQADISGLSGTAEALAERIEEVRRHLGSVTDDLRESLHRAEASFELRFGHLEDRLGQLETKLSLVFGELSDHGSRFERLEAEMGSLEERWLKRQLRILQDHLAAIVEAEARET